MFVISRPGDEIALSFDAAALPPLPPGWTRTFLLYGDGFSKEMDLNSASPDTVEPLPFHGMTRYPYGPGEHYPRTPAHERYREATTRGSIALGREVLGLWALGFGLWERAFRLRTFECFHEADQRLRLRTVHGAVRPAACGIGDKSETARQTRAVTESRNVEPRGDVRENAHTPEWIGAQIRSTMFGRHARRRHARICALQSRTAPSTGNASVAL